MVTIELSDIILELSGQIGDKDQSGRIIWSKLKESCPCCGEPWCDFSCDESQGQWNEGEDSIEYESEDDVHDRLLFNEQMDAIEALVLAHACGGVDVTTKEYQLGIEAAVRRLLFALCENPNY